MGQCCVCYSSISTNTGSIKDKNNTFPRIWLGSSVPSSSISRRAFSPVVLGGASVRFFFVCQISHLEFPFHRGTGNVSPNATNPPKKKKKKSPKAEWSYSLPSNLSGCWEIFFVANIACVQVPVLFSTGGGCSHLRLSKQSFRKCISS